MGQVRPKSEFFAKSYKNGKSTKKNPKNIRNLRKFPTMKFYIMATKNIKKQK